MKRQAALVTGFVLAAAPCLAQEGDRPFCWSSPTRACDVILITENEIGVVFESLRHGVRVRGRRFVGSHSSVEASLGLVRGEVGSYVGAEAVGLSLDARYNVQDKLTILVGYDNFEWPDPLSSSLAI